jgi:lysine 2,3-aminomutase
MLEPSSDVQLQHLRRKEDFMEDVASALSHAPMTVSLTAYILSRIDWTRALDDPIRRQFIPLRSAMAPDHPSMELDSLNEVEDSPMPGLVHRYPEKSLFLGKCCHCRTMTVESPDTF